MPSFNKNIILSILILFSMVAKGQTEYGNLHLKIISKKYPSLWSDCAIITNQHKTVQCKRGQHKNKYDSIPVGNYSVIVYSEFGDKIVKEVTIKRRNHLRINTDDFYKEDTFKTSFLDRLSVSDTLLIYEVTWGCFFHKDKWAIVTKQDSSYFIKFFIDTQVVSMQLNNQEINELKSLEVYGRALKRSSGRRYSNYYLCLGRQILDFSAGGPYFMSNIEYDYLRLKTIRKPQEPPPLPEEINNK